MTFKRKLFFVIYVGLSVALLLSIVSRYYVIAFARQECLPYKMFFIKRNVPVTKGDFVYFRGTNVPGYREKIRLVKILAGIPGETVTVKKEKDYKTQQLEINGKKRRYTIVGYVSIPYKDMELPLFEKDSKGEPLPKVLPDGASKLEGYFVIGTHPGSYDSRYFGTIPKEDILGKAYPIF